MGEAIDIFRLSGMKYPIHILASTFSTVSLETLIFRFVLQIASVLLIKTYFRFQLTKFPESDNINVDLRQSQTIREGGGESHGSSKLWSESASGLYLNG
jgi:hypothetical protein